MIGKDQWANWKDHPCTQEMMKQIVTLREEGFVDLSYGGEDNALLHLGTKIGKINAFTVLLNYGFIQEEDTNDDGKSRE